MVNINRGPGLIPKVDKCIQFLKGEQPPASYPSLQIYISRLEEAVENCDGSECLVNCTARQVLGTHLNQYKGC